MDKNFLLTKHLGEFFSKMYEANQGRDIEISLRMSDNSIQVYDKEAPVDAFRYVSLVNEVTDIDNLVQSLTK